MGALQQILVLFIDAFFQLYLIVLMLRLLLQLVRADFYNPISQFVVKVTSPLLNPLRRVIPGIGGVDMACVLLIILTQVVAILLPFLIMHGGIPNLFAVFIVSIIKCLSLLLNIYFFGILGVIIVSFIAQGNYHPAILLLHQLIDPVLKPFRDLIPPVGGLDFSPMVVLLVIKALEIVLSEITGYLF